MDELSRLTTALAERYQIEREIGKGGMATVYLARDVRHDRLVALKLLNPELGAILGVERFLAEIRVTANLQHPNLLPLFDSGEADGLLFYVMPYIEGESLRARLGRERQLPIDEAVRLATAVAGALDYAHRHGVIHRDLKPENILLNDGQPLVADFGIALAVSKAGGARITQTGLSLGTPQYMSPEQATGDRVIDGRTDIYSLGAVTYEMLTGEPPHTAATSQGIIAKLMVEEPRPLTVLRRSVPPQVEAAVMHALEKLPADRFPTAREFADALNGKVGVRYDPVRATASRWRNVAAGLLVVAAIGGIAAAVMGSKLARIGPPQSVHFKLDVPEGQQFVSTVGAPIAISPDGQTIAYSGTGPQTAMLYVRRLDELQTNIFPAGEQQFDLKFSPDGRWISFVSSPTQVSRISSAGGALATIARPRLLQATSWAPDGGFLYADGNALWRVDAPGSTPRKILDVAATLHASGVALPWVFPNGRDLMFWVLGGTGPRLAVASIDGTNITTFPGPAGNTLGYRDGWLIYGRDDGAIVARRFDQRAHRFSGDAASLLDGARWKDQGGLEASLSTSGTLAYIRGDANAFLSILDDRGATPLATTVHGGYENPAWSPDGKKVAVDVFASDGSSSIWVYDVASKVLSRLTRPGTNGARPVWTPDGKRVAFALSGDADSAIWSVPADLSGPEELLYAAPGKQFREVTFSADKKYAVLRTDTRPKGTQADIYVLPLDGADERKAVPLVQTTAEEEMPSVSPDSHWLAYVSDETGRFEIYVRPFPGGGGRVQVSADGGTAPRWTPDGSHIVYRGPREFWSATVATAGGIPQVIGRDSLFADSYQQADADHQSYDIARDGRFALFRPSGNVDIVVITNWWAEAKAKLPR